ncbi:MAG: DUF4838 domain-containing protein [Candidatus Omnitrophica bacterium]|nr:DUF4838 domain-containing protein [Candidatus Omnitrophota bacterium]
MSILIFLVGMVIGKASPINFIWKGKDYDVKGSMASGQEWMKVEYPVEEGKGTVCIVREGKPVARIVLSSNPTKSAQIAAEELNYYIEKITGTKLPVVTDVSRPIKGDKILIGESQLTKILGLENKSFEPQQYIIKTYGNILVLMGYDEEEYGLIDYNGTGLWHGFTIYYDWSLKPEISKKIGTIYAVDEFLQRYCGVRWYMPGEIGEVCPKNKNIIVKDINLELKPWTTYRWIGPLGFTKPFNFIGSGKKIERMEIRDINLWLMRMKLIGIEAYNANHSLIADWFKQRFPNKKEILAKGYERPTQLCLSSKELLKIVCNDADDYFAGRTNYERSYGDYFCVMPHDTHEYCKCEECQKLIKKDEEVKGTWWNDKVSNYVWNFVNEVAKYVKKKHPDKWVSCCSYAGYTLVPDKVKLSNNIAVTICRVLIEGIKDPNYKNFYQENIKDWAKTVKRWYIWEYFDHIQGNDLEPSNFPGIFLHPIAEDIRFLKENGCRGLFNELSSVGGLIPNYTLDHLNLYVQLKLLEDSNLNVDEILDEYCKLFYGPAYEPMKQFFVKMEERYTNPENWKLSPEEIDPNWDKICPGTQLKIFEELINKAIPLANEEPYVTRVKLIKEAVYEMMEKNYMKHLVISKGIKRKIKVSFVENLKDIFKKRDNYIEKFYSINGNPTYVKTEAYIGYDKENLYVNVRCWENDMSKIRANTKPEKPSVVEICGDDTIELFIDPGRTRERYYQILANTNGAIIDAKFIKGMPGDFNFSTGVLCKVTKNKECWGIDFKIPFLNLIGKRSVEKGEIWGFNVCRNRPREGETRENIWTCWCPTEIGFHVPERFGIIEFE